MGGAGLRSEEAKGTAPRRGRGWRLAGWAALGFLVAAALAVLVVPLVWPVSPLPNTAPARELADADSRFVEVDGIEFHYKQAGADSAPCTVVLLHGFGASVFSWRDTLPSLGSECRVIAFDRPGFGLTGRPLPGDWTGANPYSPEAHADQTVRLMDALGVEQAVLVGHSAGAAVAVLVAARHPARVAGLVLEAPAIYAGGGVPDWLSPLLRTPQARRVGPLFVRRLAGAQSDDFIRSAFADPSKVTAAVLEGYRAPLRAENWDRALWEFTAAPRSTDVAGCWPGCASRRWSSGAATTRSCRPATAAGWPRLSRARRRLSCRMPGTSRTRKAPRRSTGRCAPLCARFRRSSRRSSRRSIARPKPREAGADDG